MAKKSKFSKTVPGRFERAGCRIMKKLLALLSFLMLCALNAQDSWKIFPESVKVIALVAPGMPASKKQMDEVIKNLQAAGYKVKVMPNARLYEAPSKIKKVPKDKRFSDLKQAWFDPEVDLIWAIRGGNHAQELVNMLDYEAMRKKQVKFVGFSNITVLHQTLQKNNVTKLYNGPSATSMLRLDPASRAWFKNCLAGAELPPIQLTALRPAPVPCSGKATGGHITMLYWAVRDNYHMPTNDKIVFLESNNRSLKDNTAILDKLIKYKYFDKCKAVIFGEFNNMSKADQLKMFKEFTVQVSCPVYYNYPYGHGKRSFLIDLDRIKTIDEKAVLNQ